jgi:hypothetical protein
VRRRPQRVATAGASDVVRSRCTSWNPRPGAGRIAREGGASRGGRRAWSRTRVGREAGRGGRGGSARARVKMPA